MLNTIRNFIINLKFLVAFYMLVSIVQAKIRIEYPNNLRNQITNGEIDMNIATFGDIPYGLTVYGTVYYDINNKDSEMACNPITTIKIERDFNFIGSNAFVMLDRGSCSFVSKARNAQSIGARAVIIINNSDDEIKDIYMIDDGTGKDIAIPTVLISKKDGQILKDYLKANENEKAKLTIEFEIEKSSTINFEIIMSTTNIEIYKLLSDLQSALNDFPNGALNFYPIYYVQSHPQYIPPEQLKDTPPSPEAVTSPDCYSNGKYCYFFDSEALGLGIYEGRNVLIEDLRQICIFKERNKANVTEFINYTSAFYTQCLNSTSPVFNTECSKKAMKSIGYSDNKVSEIENCITSSFLTTNPNDWDKVENNILKREKHFLQKMHVIINPSIIVNKKLIYVSCF